MRLLWAKLASILVVCAIGLTSIGCETTEGVGRDLENAGDSLEDAAQDAKD